MNAIRCPHRPPCPGCPRFAEQGIAVLARDALNELAHAHGLPDITVFEGPSTGFRHRARLAIRGRAGAPKLGLFELDSHRVVHIPHCVVHHPLINRVANVARRALAETRTTCYSDTAHLGLARYLQVAVERSSQSAQVVLVANSESPEPLAPCLDLIRERLAKDLHSLWFNANTAQSNTILGRDFHHWCGHESIVERFEGPQVCYPPGAFGQNNLEAAQALIAHVRELIPSGASVTEFYAGVGAIGLSVLNRVGKISMNEVSPGSLLGLEQGLARLTAEEKQKVTVLAGEAGRHFSAVSAGPVVIVDPPRKGLDADLCEFMRDNPPQRLIYVSCGLESFLADTARLVSRRTLRLAALRAFNLLPFTRHVEVVAQFERVA